ncbi:alpha/beta fold hydrolase [Hymenobacter terricola]|uniref:alpha/beta fold hydrolase n=1 Tax=Hymenobacter terricola TaxID=2819236 RepID=UPI001B313F7F|nr:alpha/beta hydrolase [Hymenobacter terricola]
MDLQFEEIDGLQIRFAHHSVGAQENVLLLGPLPESILAFTPVWDRLAADFDLLAIDLPGFGHSAGRSDLSGCETMAAFVNKVLDHFSFATPHIIGPDIGTPIALFMAAQFPERVKSLIVSGGACVYPLEVGPFIGGLIAAPDLSGFKGVAAKDAVTSSLSTLKNYQVPEAILADYTASYEGEGRLLSAFQFLKNYVLDLPVLDRLLDGIRSPVKIIWGRNDAVAPVRNAEILHKRLPNSELSIIDGGVHYVWEDNSAEYLALLLDWLNGGYLKFSPVAG